MFRRFQRNRTAALGSSVAGLVGTVNNGGAPGIAFFETGLADCNPPPIVEWYRQLGRRADAMSLNIKNKETHKLANQLAKLTGENMTEAVTNAVRERLDRVRCQRGSGLADRLIRIGKDCAARLKEPFRSKDHGDLLYDEKGLPK